MQHIGVVGAGAWGTALAMTARRAGRQVTLWVRESALAAELNQQHSNSLYLPGLPLDPAIRATQSMTDICAADAVLLVCPAQHLRSLCQNLAAHWPAGLPAVICCKGIEQGSHAMMTDVVQQTLPQAQIAVLSGPTFAAEVARGLPTAVTLACAENDLRHQLIQSLGTPTFRPYGSDDLIGAEIGGAVKNVLAIACGMVEGRKLGDNARAALITRGLAEMSRLALAKGGRAETLMGLAGLGDLMLTASSPQSRNYSLGLALGGGRSLADVLGERHSVTEGVWSAAAVVELAQMLGIEMPICAAVDAILNRGIPLDDAIQNLLSRPFRPEGV